MKQKVAIDHQPAAPATYALGKPPYRMLGKRAIRIPFNRACFMGREAEYMAEALRQGWIAGNGPFTRKCEVLLEEQLGVKRVLLTTSGTHALEMISLLLRLHPGDAVIVPSFTFPSTVNAFVLSGAQPLFADIRPDTFNIDETKIEKLLRRHRNQVRAIVVVHYAGIGCCMERILALGKRYGVAVVEDNAHGLGAAYQGRSLGTFGALAMLSFHETKNFTCGEGGALIINDPWYIDRAEIIREKGTDRSRFFRGEISKYQWQDVGSSYVPSDLLAAVLYGQLEKWEEIQKVRGQIWSRYFTGLTTWATKHGVHLPVVPTDCRQPYHLFSLLLPSAADRDTLINHLAKHGILATSHYQPLHLSPMGQRLGTQASDCPITESVSQRLLRLPLYNSLTPSEQDQVIAKIRAWIPKSPM